MAFHESQLQAIRHKDGPMLVLAGPGSGKTTVITHRIQYLVEKYQVEPGSILVITFTKAAAQEMKLRFQALMEGRKLFVSFGTFHAVFFSILKHAYRYNASNIIREEQRTDCAGTDGAVPCGRGGRGRVCKWDPVGDQCSQGRYDQSRSLLFKKLFGAAV